MGQSSLPPSTSRRWTPSEDVQLHHLRIIEHMTFPEIAQTLGRTTHAVQGRYYKLQQAQASSFEEWTGSMDDHIINGRRRGLTSREIGVEMNLPGEAVQGRWYELQQLKMVPEDVLTIWRRKEEVTWSEAEDEVILNVWMKGRDEDELVKGVMFEGKYGCDVRERIRVLRREEGPIYRRLMGLEESKPLPHALERALGKKKYAWM